MVFFDLAKASDTLVKRQRDQFLKKTYLFLLISLSSIFSDAMMAWICIGGNLSEPINVGNGVKWGGILATILLPSVSRLYFKWQSRNAHMGSTSDIVKIGSYLI